MIDTHKKRVSYLGSGLAAALLALAISATFMALSEDCIHWFAIPLTLCGFLIGIDGVHWVRRGYDVLDPYGIFGAFGILAFQIIPFLHVMWRIFPQVPNTPQDWIHWLGIMAWLNVLGLILLHLTRRLFPTSFLFPAHRVWRVSRRRLAILTPAFLLVAVAFQCYVFYSVGGLAGMTEYGVLDGKGFLVMIGESIPALVIFAVTLKWRFLDNRRISSSTLALFVAAMLALIFFVTGLRGSRSNILSAVIVLVCTIHLVWRPIPRRLVLLGIPLLFAFITLYGLFKTMRSDITQVRSLADYRARTEQSRNWKTTILSDLGRSDVQAVLCYHVCSQHARLRYGETYLHAFSLAIPRSFRPNLTSKVVAGTYAMTGHEMIPDSQLTGLQQGGISRVYGWAGEAMLNFGPIGVPLAFIAFALWQTAIARFPSSLPNGDIRILVYPFFYINALTMIADLNLVVFNLIKNGAFPCLFLILVSKRIPIPRNDAGGQ